MATDPLEYLTQKGLNPKRATRDEVHIACLWCGEDPGKRGRLYVNVDPLAEIIGLNHCKLCDHRGSLVTIQKHFGDVTDKQEKEDTGYKRRAILAEAAAFYFENLKENTDALDWLTDVRGLTMKTIKDHQLGYANGGLFKHLRVSGYAIEDIHATGLTTTNRETQRTVDFFTNHITIPYHTAGNVVMIRGRDRGDAGVVDPGRKYLTGPGQKTRLFNTDVTWGADELVVTEGEFDALVLEQYGFKAVACPGAGVWQASWDSYFDEARRVWVVFDRDERETGQKGARKVIEHLGTKARRVELPPHEHGKSKNDITEFFVVQHKTVDDFTALVRASSQHLISVAEAIREHTELQSQEGVKFGLRMDLQMAPGLLKSQVLVYLAKTGSGKSIWLLNLFQRICTLDDNAKILFLSLEQTRGDWWERARRIYRFFNLGTTDADAQKFWTNRIWIDDRNRIRPESLYELIEDFQYQTGQMPTIVAIDYLGYWAQSFKGERYERTSDAIMSLKAIAKDLRIAVVTPHQVSRMTMHGSEPSIEAARDSGVVEETADFVMALWSPDTVAQTKQENQTGEFNIKIAKSRHGGVGYVEKFYFAPLSLAIVSADDHERVSRARHELWYRTEYVETWEQALIRHQTGLDYKIRDYDSVVKSFGLKMGRLAREAGIANQGTIL